MGVFPEHGDSFAMKIGLPHARGGVSYSISEINEVYESSPRTWGCFHLIEVIKVIELVFPTHVGVFR